jgi:hypothetical protein
MAPIVRGTGAGRRAGRVSVRRDVTGAGGHLDGGHSGACRRSVDERGPPALRHFAARHLSRDAAAGQSGTLGGPGIRGAGDRAGGDVFPARGRRWHRAAFFRWLDAGRRDQRHRCGCLAFGSVVAAFWSIARRPPRGRAAGHRVVLDVDEQHRHGRDDAGAGGPVARPAAPRRPRPARTGAGRGARRASAWASPNGCSWQCR